jgi:hypothetical protein
MVVNTYNHSTGEIGGGSQVQGHPGLHSKILSKKKEKKEKPTLKTSINKHHIISL